MKKHIAESTAVRELISDYYEAVYNRDHRALSLIFHEKAAVFGLHGEFVLSGKADVFFDTMSSRDESECFSVMTSFELTGNNASASYYVRGFYGENFTFYDEFSLVKEDDSWKIVFRMFTVTDV